jgi:4-hydroxy-tetrahydrodipicolinate synthase
MSDFVDPYSELTGLWSPILTPLDEDDAIDTRRLGGHAQRLLDAGCEGIVLFGTTGEAPSFAVNERQRTLEALLNDGFPARRVIVGTGCTALPDALDLTRHARDCGVLAVLVLPPFYYKTPPLAGLVRYFDAVFGRLGGSETRGLLYNFPRLAGLAVTPELGRAVVEKHGVVVGGAKDSSGDADSVRAFCESFSGRAVFPGTEAVLVEALAAGAAGLISATANVDAPGLLAILKAWRAGDRDRAAELQRIAVERREPYERNGIIPSLKAALAEQLGDPTWRRVRPPWIEAI